MMPGGRVICELKKPSLAVTDSGRTGDVFGNSWLPFVLTCQAKVYLVFSNCRLTATKNGTQFNKTSSKDLGASSELDLEDLTQVITTHSFI